MSARPSYALLTVVVLALIAGTLSIRAGSIFDDDWTPPTPRKASPTTPQSTATQPGTPTTETPGSAKPAALNTGPVVGQSGPTATAQAGQRLAVPAPPLQARSRALFKEAFAKDLADRRPASRRALARRLLDAASTAQDNATDRFVLLVGAMDAGAEGADLSLSLRAADDLAKSFDVDGVRVKAQLAGKASLRSNSPFETKANCGIVLEVVDQLIAAEDYTDALKLLNAIKSAAPNDATFTLAVQRRTSQIDTIRVVADRVAQQAQHLKSAPDDPAANLAVGRFLCLLKGDWSGGLPLLARSGDPKLAPLAKLELSAPSDTAKKEELADAWWDVAEKESGAWQDQARRHGGAWYEAALPCLSGLRKATAQARIDALKPPVGKTIDLLSLIDPSKDAVGRPWEFRNGELVSIGEREHMIEAPYVPPEEYDFEIEFTRLRVDDEAVVQAIVHGNVAVNWFIQQGHAGLYPMARNSKSVPYGRFAVGVRHRGLVQVRNDGVRTYLDGKLLLDFKTDYSDVDPSGGYWKLRDRSLVGLGATDEVVFHVAKVTEVTGKGTIKER